MADREQQEQAVTCRTPSVGWPELVLWVVAPLVAFGGYLSVTFMGMSLDGCEGICRDELIFTTYRVYPWLLLLAVVAPIVVGAVVLLRGRRTAWVAASGIALVIAVLAGATAALHAGFQPMYDRNARISDGNQPPSPPPPDPTGSWTAQAVSQPASTLTVASDHSVEGFDGCNPLRGTWKPGDDEFIMLSLTVEGSAACDGVDTWLDGATSAFIHGGNLVVNGAGDTPIGVLFPAD